jgi:SARP family transcriptional regulator, regulator of embCAB operon
VTLASEPHVRIQICGPLVIDRAGDRLESLLPGRQGRVAFTYLVTQRHRQISRDELASALWPDGSAADVQQGLNPLLSKLRKALGADAIEGRSTLRLHLPSAWVDLEAALDAIHRAESAVAQQSWVKAWGPAQVAMFVAARVVLVGEEAPWIDDLRRRLDDIHLRALDCYAAAELGIGGVELAGAARASRQLIALAPLRESGYRYLMGSLAAQGNLAEALHCYTALCDTLRDQLGIAPSPATRALYDELLRAHA